MSSVTLFSCWQAMQTSSETSGFYLSSYLQSPPCCFRSLLIHFFSTINHTRCKTLYIGAELNLIHGLHKGQSSTKQWWWLTNMQRSLSIDGSNNNSKLSFRHIKQMVPWPRCHYLILVRYGAVSDQSRRVIVRGGSHIYLLDWLFFADIIEPGQQRIFDCCLGSSLQVHSNDVLATCSDSLLPLFHKKLYY